MPVERGAIVKGARTALKRRRSRPTKREVVVCAITGGRATPLLLRSLRTRARRSVAGSARWTTRDIADPDCWIPAIRKYARWLALPAHLEHSRATDRRAERLRGAP